MKSIIVLPLVALAHARCDYPSGIGLWHPERGQNFAVVMWDLGITEPEFEALNPTTNINLIYPELSYNVTIRPSRSGKWTDGCPPSLRIKDMSDTSIVDPTTETQETPESTSVADQSEDVHEVPSMSSDDAQQETVLSYATMDDEMTRTTTQSHIQSTSVAAEATNTVNEKEQKPESATEATSAPSSISGATKLETAPSSTLSTTTTLTQTDDSHVIKTERSSGTSFKEECTDSSKDLSAQKSSGGAHTGPASILTTDTATSSISQTKETTGSATISAGTTVTENTSTQTKSADPDTVSDQSTSTLHTALTKTTAEVVTSSYTDSTEQTGKQTTTLSTETKTTLVTSPSKTTSETTATANSYNEEETRRAMCSHDSTLFGLGQTDGDIVLQMVKDFCGRPDIDRSMKHGDECIEFYRRDSSKIDYTFEICPNGNCLIYGQNMRNPFGQNGLSCVDIFFHTIWRWCKPF
ncbi:hypothetical protein RAB80_017440 [Fusarium oxysporum f. sp. vasinfectum]|nr:hypothetical protein RAB80_017440 [Fusarium oxysporum f. sp. vasinfectum]KAK2922581.1 hypothetical protein FoTM2_017434 [Fusarium oxysporum f. sp. vasinfectum]